MPTFIGITDIHMAQRHTRYRHHVDDDIVAKVKYVIQKCEDASAMPLCAGDWFHNADCSFGVVAKLGDTLQRLPQGRSVMGITGQHDLPDHGDWRKGPAYLLSWLPFTHIVGEPRWQVLSSGAPTRVFDPPAARHTDPPYVLAAPYGADINDASGVPDESAIIIVHAMLVPKPVPWDHILLDDFERLLPQDGRERVVFSGDYHAGYPVTKINDTWFCNPGALTRINRDDAGRQPQYVQIEWQDGPQQIEYHPVPCRPGSEVFDMEGHGQEEQAMTPERQSEFAELLKDARERVAAGQGLTQEVLDQLQVQSAVRQCLAQALDEARGKLGYE